MISESSSLLDVGCIVCSGLESRDQRIPVGWAVVSIYSENEFQSYDLDFISFGDFKSITSVMVALGFSQEKGRHFVHEFGFFVEFLETPPPSVTSRFQSFRKSAPNWEF